MKLIAGLGNPGARYERTRHNVGFDAIAELARRWKLAVARYEARFEALTAEAYRGEARVLLMQPQTFMNLSGRSVAAVARFYKLEPADLLVVYDDVDTPVGQLRVRAEGSSGGQKGMESVIRALSSEQIARVRIGVGRPPPGLMVEWVLTRFTPQERDEVDRSVQDAAAACELWVSEGTTAAMNRFNRRTPGRERGADAQGESS